MGRVGTFGFGKPQLSLNSGSLFGERNGNVLGKMRSAGMEASFVSIPKM